MEMCTGDRIGYNHGAMARPRRRPADPPHFTVSRAAEYTSQALQQLAGAAQSRKQAWVFVDVGVGEGGRHFGTPEQADAAHRRETAARSGQPPLPRRVLMRIAKAPDGRLICTGLVLGAFDDDEITARTYRRLPLIEFLTEAARWSERQPDLARQVFGGELPRRGGARVRPGPKGHDDKHFKLVAGLYRRALLSRPRAPVQMLLELINEGREPGGEWSEATVRRWLQRARDKGFLREAQAGKAGEVPETKRRKRR
jgi:hypothetical protein